MPWETSSGLLDDYVGTITDAEFAIDANYNATATLLWLTFDVEDRDQPIVEKYSLGDGWFSYDNKTVSHTEGRDKFNSASWYGYMIDQIAKKPDLKGALDILQERGDPTDARVWIGLRFHMQKVTRTIMKEERSRNMPVEFLGVDNTVDTSGQATREELDEKLKEIAAQAPDHNSFMESAMGLPGVEGNATLVMAIADPDGLYKELKQQ